MPGGTSHSILLLIIPQLVLSIYTNDPLLAEASVPSLYVICFAALTLGFGMTFFEAVSGTGNTINALLLESVVLAAYTLSVWFFASYIGTHVEWVWTSEITYGILIGVLSLFYMKFAHWQKKKI